MICDLRYCKPFIHLRDNIILALERKNGQSISLFVEGQEVKIKLVYSEMDRAKIGVDAPEDTLILREEDLNASPDSFELHALA